MGPGNAATGRADGAGHGAVAGGSPRSTLGWVLLGARAAFGIPGLVLFSTYFGFGALTSDTGWPFWAAVLSTPVIWAAPGQVVMAGAFAGGAGVLGTAIAVSISSVRLAPMVAALMPILRGPRTSFGAQLLAAHYIAVTAWVEGLRLTPELPREVRMPFFLGLGTTLCLASTGATAIGHHLSTGLPWPLAVALLMLTPIYFTLSLERSARRIGDRLAVLFGLLLGPLAASWLSSGLDLMTAGLLGGTLAFLIDRRLAAARAA